MCALHAVEPGENDEVGKSDCNEFIYHHDKNNAMTSGFYCFLDENPTLRFVCGN